MARPALLPVTVVAVLLLAGCSGLPGAGGTTTPADIEAEIVDSQSTGGQCVDDPIQGVHVESVPDDPGTRLVTVAANVTVPGAHYVVDEVTVTRTGETATRLDVNTTTDPGKPEQACEHGGIVHYEATLRVPDTDPFELEIRHDGRPVSGVGSGTET